VQKRLPQELRLAKIRTIAGGNRYLKERFICRLQRALCGVAQGFVPKN
jgi:hypothetical protein